MRDTVESDPSSHGNAYRDTNHHAYAKRYHPPYTHADANRLPPIWMRNANDTTAGHGYANALSHAAPDSNGYTYCDAFSNTGPGLEYLDAAPS